MPTITIGQNSTDDYSGLIDTFIMHNGTGTADTVNFDFQSDLWAYASPDPDTRVTLIKATMPGILTGATITSASLFVHQVDHDNALTIELRRMLRAWTDTGATWLTSDGSTSWGTSGAQNNTSDRDSTIVSSVVIGAGDADITWHEFTGLASLVQAWVDGTYSNHGVQLQKSVWGAEFYLSQMESSNASDGNRPYLSVTYTAGAGGSSSNGGLMMLGCGS